MSFVKHTALLLALAIGLITSAQAGTKLQVFVTGSMERAQAIVSALDSAGYGPASYEADASRDLFRVYTKEYDSYAEAEFVKPALRNAGYADVFSVSTGDDDAPAAADLFGDLPSIAKSKEFERLRIDFQTAKPSVRKARITAEQEATDDSLLSEGELFAKANAWFRPSHADKALASFDSYIARFPNSPQAAQAKLMRAYWLLEKKDIEAARRQFAGIGRQHAGSPEAGEAALRLCYLMLRDNAPAGETLNAFLRIARGEVPASSEVRIEAMLRCAALYHRGKDLATALAAYQSIEQATEDREVRAFAQMQRAGLLMEQAWNDNATFAQARAVADDLLQRYPNVNAQTRATAALMALETLAYEGSYEAVLKRSSNFSEEFGDTPEAPFGYYWAARAMLETGDPNGAAAVLETLISAEFETNERFRSVDFDESARRLAAKAYRAAGNETRAQEVLTR